MAKLRNIELVDLMVEHGYINVQKHPTADLYIYNYSKSAQMDNVWNEATTQCRGIICDADKNIIARPFEKFYNYEELVNKNIKIPNLPFEVFEKLDGSLGILYFIDNSPYIATRGSFTSVQAEHATNVLYQKYSDKLSLLDKSKTYLFEIIYKDNDSHLVVNYGDTDDIFLLAVINTETGEEYNIDDYKHIFKTTIRYDGITDYLKLREMFSGENKEGFVIKFSNNFRMKLKFVEYFRLHALISCLSEKVVFGYIASNTTEQLEEILDRLDEEHHIYLNKIVDKILDKEKEIRKIVASEYKEGFASKKEAAEYFLKCSYPYIMFLIYDKKDYNKFTEAVWNAVSKELYGRPWQLKTYLQNLKSF